MTGRMLSDDSGERSFIGYNNHLSLYSLLTIILAIICLFLNFYNFYEVIYVFDLSVQKKKMKNYSKMFSGKKQHMPLEMYKFI